MRASRPAGPFRIPDLWITRRAVDPMERRRSRCMLAFGAEAFRPHPPGPDQDAENNLGAHAATGRAGRSAVGSPDPIRLWMPGRP